MFGIRTKSTSGGGLLIALILGLLADTLSDSNQLARRRPRVRDSRSGLEACQESLRVPLRGCAYLAIFYTAKTRFVGSYHPAHVRFPNCLSSSTLSRELVLLLRLDVMQIRVDDGIPVIDARIVSLFDAGIQKLDVY